MPSNNEIKTRYCKAVLGLLGRSNSRRFIIRQPLKFIKILTAKTSKIPKRLSYGYFAELSESEKTYILGHVTKDQVLSYNPIPRLESRGLSVKEYKKLIQDITFRTKKSEAPKFSIIIPVYEQFEMTLDCLKSIEHNYSDRTDYEVIIADDSVKSDYEKLLAEAEVRHVIVENNSEEQAGFLPNCNNASKKAEGQYLIFLNNDTLVLPNWLEGLERHLNEETMIVGSKLIYEDGVLQEAGGAIFNDGGAANIGKFTANDNPLYNFSRVSDYISGASLCVNAKWFHDTGRFDERYTPAYYEDTDLCVRAKKEGYKVMYSAESQVIHFEGRSCGTDVESETGLKRFQKINRKKFLEKWDLSDYGDPISPDEHYKLTHKRPTILVVCPYPVRTDSDSGSKRMFYLVEILQKYYDVVLYASSNDNRVSKNEGWVRDLNLMGIEIITKEYYPFFSTLILERDFSLAWVSWLESADYFIQAIDKHNIEMNWIYDTVDVHYIREARKANINLIDRSSLIRETCFEREMTTISRANQFVVVSDFEYDHMRFTHNLSPVIVGNIEKESVANVYKPEAMDNNIAFVGNFFHEPNVTSIYKFLKKYWKDTLHAVPDIKLKIVGKGSEEHAEKLQKYQNVEVLGWVESVEEHIKDCKLTIVPLLHGAGVKGKINQSLACGIPVLTTEVGGEGMCNLSAACGIIISELDQFPAQLHLLLQDPKRLVTESDAGKEWVQQICGFEKADEKISRLLNTYENLALG